MERLIHGIFCWIALTMFALGAGCYAFGLITTGGGAGSSGDTAGFIGSSPTDSREVLRSGDLGDTATWQTFTATASGTIGYMHTFINGCTGGVNMAIYTSGGTLLGDGSITILDATYEWKTVQLDSAVSITAGTDYRLAIGFDTADSWVQTTAVTDGGGAIHYDNSYTITNDMSATPAGYISDSTNDLAIYADNTGGNT